MVMLSWMVNYITLGTYDIISITSRSHFVTVSYCVNEACLFATVNNSRNDQKRAIGYKKISRQLQSSLSEDKSKTKRKPTKTSTLHDYCTQILKLQYTTDN